MEELSENCQGPNCAYEELYRRKLDLTIHTQLLLRLIASQVISFVGAWCWGMFLHNQRSYGPWWRSMAHQIALKPMFCGGKRSVPEIFALFPLLFLWTYAILPIGEPLNKYFLFMLFTHIMFNKKQLIRNISHKIRQHIISYFTKLRKT